MKRIKYTNWHEARTKGIGGSDSATVLGLNKYKSKFQLWLEKTGQHKEEINNKFIYWGNRLEELIANEFKIQTGYKIQRNNFILQHDDHEFILGNIDREGTTDEGEKFVLECKTASQYVASDWENEEIPVAYELQLQHYLLVTGYNIGYIAVLIGGNDFRYRKIEADKELHKIMIEQYSKFWDMVQKEEAPAVDGSDSCKEFLGKLFPQSIEQEIELMPSNLNLLQVLENCKERVKELSERQQEIENQIKLEMSKSEKAICGDWKVSWKTSVSKRLDTKKLKEEQKDIYEKYTKESSSRRFLVKKTKEA